MVCQWKTSYECSFWLPLGGESKKEKFNREGKVPAIGSRRYRKMAAEKRRGFPVNWGDPDVVKLKWMDGMNAVKIELARVKESDGPFCNTAGER
jgi:hypothetical protein